jgi:hypothetical protein
MEQAKEIYYKRLYVFHKEYHDCDEQNLFIKFLQSSNDDVDHEWLQNITKSRKKNICPKKLKNHKNHEKTQALKD